MEFSAALCRGLIEAIGNSVRHREVAAFSAALCRGLIEALRASELAGQIADTFSAALCRGLIEAFRGHRLIRQPVEAFSAALCRGLIEASLGRCPSVPSSFGFPRLYAAASLKQRVRPARAGVRGGVFRGFMPRPH